MSATDTYKKADQLVKDLRQALAANYGERDRLRDQLERAKELRRQAYSKMRFGPEPVDLEALIDEEVD